MESGFGPGSFRSRVSVWSQAGQCSVHEHTFDKSCLDEEGEEFGEEDSGVESGFGRDSPRPLLPPAPVREHVASMLNHLAIPLFR